MGTQLHRKHNPKANLTFTEFQHSTWDQKSIILRWSPRANKSAVHSAPVIILSAHQDSTGPLPFLRAPGADDDGSGTAALVETVSVLLQNGWEPTDSAVEWMFFSAEECGSCGSSEIVKSYRAQGREIRAMYHMDVTAYLRPGTEPVIGLITDGVSPALTDYIELLIDKYATIPAARTQCGYACRCVSRRSLFTNSPLHISVSSVRELNCGSVRLSSICAATTGALTRLDTPPRAFPRANSPTRIPSTLPFSR